MGWSRKSTTSCTVCLATYWYDLARALTSGAQTHFTLMTICIRLHRCPGVLAHSRPGACANQRSSGPTLNQPPFAPTCTAFLKSVITRGRRSKRAGSMAARVAAALPPPPPLHAPAADAQ